MMFARALGPRALLQHLPPWSPWLGMLLPVVLTILMLRVDRQERFQRLARESATASQGIVEDLGARLDYYRNLGLTLAREEDVQELLTRQSAEKARSARVALTLIARASRTSIDQLRVLDVEGGQRLWVGFDERSGEYRERSPDPAGSVAPREWFQRGLILPSWQVWTGRTELYRGYGRWVFTPGVPIEPYLRIVVPVFKPGGDRLGMIVMNLHVEGRAFGGRTEERPWQVLGEDGHFIYSGRPFPEAAAAGDGTYKIPTLREIYGVDPVELSQEKGQLPVSGGVLFYHRFRPGPDSCWFLLQFTPNLNLHQLGPGSALALVAMWTLSLTLVLLLAGGIRQLRHQREREQLGRLLDAILRAPTGLGILVSDPTGMVRRFNVGAQSILGLGKEAAGKVRVQDLIGIEPQEAAQAGNPERQDSGEGAAGPGLDEADYRLVATADGRRVMVAPTVSPLRTRTGDLFGYLVQVQDVGRIMAREEMLREAAREAQAASRLKSAFLATMSHEVRTPMNGILGMVRVLKTTPLSEEQAEIVEVGERGARNLLGLLDAVLDLSKLEAGKVTFEKSPFSPVQVTRECAAMWRVQAESKGLAFATKLPADGVLVLGDSIRLGQVLNNLLGNACKFTESGRVELDLQADRIGPLLVLAWEIRDTGPGIPLRLQSRIFNPFTQADDASTRNHGGTGLGLAICREIATGMGGSLEVVSQPGQGSTFRLRISLPVVEAG